MNEDTSTHRVADMKCDITEHRPTFFISHDDIYNLGHHINDVVAVWTMVVMSGRKFSDALLVNMDGLRAGGPAGGPAHRLMLAHDPDSWVSHVLFHCGWSCYFSVIIGMCTGSPIHIEVYILHYI